LLDPPSSRKKLKIRHCIKHIFLNSPKTKNTKKNKWQQVFFLVDDDIAVFFFRVGTFQVSLLSTQRVSFVLILHYSMQCYFKCTMLKNHYRFLIRINYIIVLFREKMSLARNCIPDYTYSGNACDFDVNII